MRATCIRLLRVIFLLCASSSYVFAQVGLQEFQAGELSVTLIYPTTEAVKPTTRGLFQFDAALNARPRKGNGRLIVLSHGSGGSAVSDHQLAATLAMAGYLVAQPLHAGDNYKDVSKAGPESWNTRPTEVSATIDALAKDQLWSTQFDVDKVGVHGMSAGGLTALAVAGGQWNLLTMIKHCGKNIDADINFCLNGLQGNRTGQVMRRAQFALGATTPESHLPNSLKELHGAKDKRVKAVSLAVPLVAPFTPTSLIAITTPVGVVSAANDEILAPDFHSTYLLEQCKHCILLMDLNNAGHFDTLSPWPNVIAKEIASKQLRGGLPHPKFDPQNRALAFEKMVLFFNHHLK